MLSPKENWFAFLNGKEYDYIPYMWEAFEGVGNLYNFPEDPQQIADTPDGPGTEKRDTFGVLWRWPEGAPGPHPINNPDTVVISDLEHWKDQLTIPNPWDLDWEPLRQWVKTVDREQKIVCMMASQGLFERSHHLMGFEIALMNYLEEPELMYELVGAITDFKIELFNCYVDALHPDAVVSLDDWGSKQNVFLPPDVWREVIKPHQKRLVEHAHNNGMVFIHHSDCICAPLLEDMIEIGEDVWQGIIPENDIVKVEEQAAGRIAFLGGLESPLIDGINTTEEQIRAEVRRCYDEYCWYDKFMPCLPSFMSFSPEREAILEDECEKYGKEFLAKKRARE